MADSPTPPPESFGIIPHPTEPMCLMRPTPTGWALPLHSPGAPNYVQAEPLNQAIRAQTGLEVTTLRLVDQTEQAQRVYAMENHTADTLPPPGWHWIGPIELAALTLAEPRLRAVLERWFAERSEPVPPLRAPWAQPGWFAEAREWVTACAHQLGLVPEGPLEQIKLWQITCVMRQGTNEGPLWFKAAPPLFAREAAVMAGLARRHPNAIPDIAAVDMDRRWLLMRDFGGTPLGDTTEIVTWEAALRLYGQIQADYANRPDELLALGCADRRLPVLEASIDGLIAACEYGLSPEEAEQARAQSPAWKAMCRELAALGIPPTLEHGDFHPWNATVTSGGILFFDWTDACLSHPFFSATTFFHLIERKQLFTDIPGARERLIQAYLEPFAAFAPPEQLRAAFDLGETVGLLHHAFSYEQMIVPACEIQAEWQGIGPSYLQTLLRKGC